MAVGIQIASGSSTINSSFQVQVFSVTNTGRLYIVSGGKVIVGTDAKPNVISSGGQVHVNGGQLSNTNVNIGGQLHISNNGIVVSTIVSNGGQIHVSSGGSYMEGSVTSNGVLIVSSGGYCMHPIITSGSAFVSGGRIFSATFRDGTVSVGSYGSAAGYLSHTIMSAGAVMNIYSGGVTSETYVLSGRINVFDGGKIQTTVVSSGLSNNIYVNSGGTALVNTLHSGAKLYVSAGGSAQTNSIGSGAEMYVNGSARYNYLAGGKANVSKGASVSSSLVSAGGSMLLNGSASETKISSGGIFDVNISGAATSTTVSTGGLMKITSGSANILTVSSGGSVSMYAGTADVVTLDGGTLIASGSAIVKNAAVSGKGLLEIKGATASSATVSSAGSFTVSSGGNAVSAMVSAAGVMNISAYGIANSATVSGGAVKVLVNGSANSTTVEAGGLLTVAGGSASNTKINSGGSFTVESGGTANGATVYAGGKLLLALTAKANNIVENGGYVDVQTNNVVTFVANTFTGVVQSATVHAGTIASDVTVQRRLEIFSGGTANKATANAGAILFVNGGGSAVSASVTGADAVMNVLSGGVADNAIVSGVRTSVSILESALATNAKVFSGGRLDVFSTGRANSAAIYSNGSMNVHSGGTADFATVQGVMDLNGTANSATVNAGGRLNVLTGAKLNNAKVNKGDINLSGGTAAGALIDGPSAYLTVFSGGTATGAAIQGGGTMVVSANGAAVSAVVSSGGSLKINNLGSASNTAVSAGRMYVSSGGSVYRATIFGNGEFTLSGGFASATSIRTGGKFIVSGGSAQYSIVSAGGSMTVHKNGKANEISLDGILAVYGVVDSAGINTTGAGMTVYNGGVAINTTVGNGATLTVSSGGKITGRFLATAEAVVSAYAGAVVDFDISSLNPANAALLNNLSLVKGAPSFTLTVNGTPADGTYKLAGGAAGFDKTISVVNTEGTSLGTLTVGQTLTVGSVDYTLNLGGDNVLSVSVGSVEPGPSGAVAKSDIDGNGVSDVMFVWTGEHGDGNYQHGYWMNGTSTWQSANSNHPAEWDNLGCYDMTGDGKADSVLFGNVTSEAGIHGAYIGYYADANDLPDGSTWVNIGYLNNVDNIDWKNKVGNLTGNASGANSIVWYAPELYALGVWTDGTENWITLSNKFGGAAWTLVGCGDFNGDGKDQVLMALNGGEVYYTVGIDGTSSELTKSDSGWEVRAIGDFSGDDKDDIVAFHAETGLVFMWNDGNSADWSQLGQLDAKDWFLVGAGDYNGDAKDDLLVRQKSTGMLGYYASGNMETGWVELGRGVDMNWTVIA